MWLNARCVVLLDMLSLMLEIGLDWIFLICANSKISFSPVDSVSLYAQTLSTSSSKDGSCICLQSKRFIEQNSTLCFRSEVPKLQLPNSTRAELHLSGSRLGQRCCSDSQHDRCSPTGRAVTTPDKSKTAASTLLTFLHAKVWGKLLEN